MTSGLSARRPESSQLLNERIGVAAFERGMGLAAHRPAHVYLQLASGCNLDCYMCSEHNRPPEWRHGRGLTSLAPELFAKIEREVLPWSLRLTIGMGGEPTLSEHFVDYVERARAAGQQITVLTNGTRLDQPGVSEAIARCVSLLQVSLDGATPETYERIRQGSSWKAMRARFEHLNEARRRHAEGRTLLSLQYVAMRSNVHELTAFVELAHELCAERVEVQHVIPVTDEGAGEQLIDEPERFNRERESAVRRAEELGLELRIPAPYPVAPPAAQAEAAPAAPPPAGAPIRCSMPTMDVFVFYDGRVFPCCHPHAQQKMQMGDLREQSFAEIWNGALFRNLRAGLARGEAHPVCRTCSIVHDPPPDREAREAAAAAPELAHFYAGRDLDPLGGRTPELLAQMRELGLFDYIEALEQRGAPAPAKPLWRRAARRLLGGGRR